jgi:carboxymethylenebutenolidase
MVWSSIWRHYGAGRSVKALRAHRTSQAAWPAYEAARKAGGAHVALHQYPGTQHGFNNDTTPRYDAPAARLAWERTVGFFKAQLA